ncbi:GGDEF domain-containing protein [uncultured Oxalicibacterium sp.]|uniref:GGDEF domain-containing protein n=1 Tax=uncultured Oxalicibacterium sp. TaxID=1168540 RepID=UPI0025F8226D|nr:GGDEF domain-containing protein [uncultured Oxalicibacterium sp.]
MSSLPPAQLLPAFAIRHEEGIAPAANNTPPYRFKLKEPTLPFAIHDLQSRQPATPANDQDSHLVHRLHEILLHRELTPLYQPIIDMQSGDIIGYEGLIRGPSDSPLHSPLNLFKVARSCGLSVEVEHLCRRITLEKFAELQLSGKLFLNVSPECLVQSGQRRGETLGFIDEVGIHPDRVIIELTESHPTYDYDLLREAVRHYRALGFVIAIDDLGEGFSSLRLWSEIRPEYVKIDMHFVQGINHDPIKLQFVRSIQEIAEKSGTVVIAEGIETDAELLMIRDLGVPLGQGYRIARPHANPDTRIASDLYTQLRRNCVAIYPQETRRTHEVLTAAKLLRRVEAVTPEIQNNCIYDMFKNDPSLEIIPVVASGVPIGLITRANLIDRFARPYLRELHGRKSCTLFMDTNPLIAEKSTPLHALSQLIVDADRHHLFNGFIITDNGQYAGMGNAHDLMREITQMQINAARYANPLTMLPGNVPIDEHIDRLLESRTPFCVCYVDLDHFKPYNDVYGYRKGDDMIRLTGQLLSAHIDPERDFVGHIGGDDFIVLFQSEDWEQRCHVILDAFATAILPFYTEDHLFQGGYISEDRCGRRVFHALATMSLGLLKVIPGNYGSHHQIATAAADAKKQAKKIPGNSLFIDRRLGPSLPIQDYLPDHE